MDTRDTRIRAPAGVVSEIKTFMRPVQPQRWDRYENTDSKSTFYYISGRGRQRISQFLLQSPQILTRRSVASFYSSAYRVLQFLNFCPWTILPFCWDIFRCVFVGINVERSIVDGHEKCLYHLIALSQSEWPAIVGASSGSTIQHSPALCWVFNMDIDCGLLTAAPQGRIGRDMLNIQYCTHNIREFRIYASCHEEDTFKASQFVTVRAVTCVKSIKLILLKSFQTLLLVTIWKCQRDVHKRKQTLRFIRLDDTRGINKYLNIGLLWDNIAIN